MLFYNTISPQLLELLKNIRELSVFDDLRLVGGTSLALQIGHRKSIDIDLFGIVDYDDYEIQQALGSLGNITVLNKTKNINIFLVNGIKVDIVNYKYKWLKEINNIDNLRLSGLEDIAAMKLNAISGRGTKKDFIDIYFLLQHFSLSEMLIFYNEKYYDGSTFLVLKSLTYFEDAEKEELPKMIKQVKWENVKKTVENATINFLKKQNE